MAPKALFLLRLSKSPQFQPQPQHRSTTFQNPIQPYSLGQATLSSSQFSFLPLIYTLLRRICLLNTPFICELTRHQLILQFNSLDISSFSSLTLWASELVQILRQTCLPLCLQVPLSHLPKPVLSMAVLPLTISPPTTTSDDSKRPLEHSVLPPRKPSSIARLDVLSSK